jgi:hypothetical protein
MVQRYLVIRTDRTQRDFILGELEQGRSRMWAIDALGSAVEALINAIKAGKALRTCCAVPFRNVHQALRAFLGAADLRHHRHATVARARRPLASSEQFLRALEND